nr:hypothetical protein [Tanacetum cinerariifolium]
MICEMDSVRESDFFLEVNAFLAIEDEFTSSQFPKSYLDPEGDMLLFEAFLNDDHSSDFQTKSSSTSPNSLLEETNNFDNSLPEFTPTSPNSLLEETNNFDNSLHEFTTFSKVLDPSCPNEAKARTIELNLGICSEDEKGKDF